MRLRVARAQPTFPQALREAMSVVEGALAQARAAGLDDRETTAFVDAAGRAWQRGEPPPTASRWKRAKEAR